LRTLTKKRRKTGQGREVWGKKAEAKRKGYKKRNSRSVKKRKTTGGYRREIWRSAAKGSAKTLF